MNTDSLRSRKHFATASNRAKRTDSAMVISSVPSSANADNGNNEKRHLLGHHGTLMAASVVASSSSSSMISDNHHDDDRAAHPNHDDGHHNGHHHHHGSSSSSSTRHLSEKVPLYAAPRQRQRWGESQVLPHVNWGDLYFDLFYVAAAYNLSHAFKADPTPQGLLWFAATYLPIFKIWNEKLIYDARYSPEDNLFHRTLEVVHLCILGTTVWYIQPSFIMSDTLQYSTTMVYAGGCLADALFYVYLYVDLYWNVEGGQEARNNALVELSRKVVAVLTYSFAFGVAAYDSLMVGGVSSVESDLSTATTSTASINNWPAYSMIGGSLFELVVFNLLISSVVMPMLGGHQNFFVPINLEFMCHRIGEWVMLMLGESVLSILTGGSGGERTQQSLSYSISFYCGILTVTMFQYLFFRSQPSEGKDHAMRRSQLGGYFFFYFHTIYSASLILVGCSYKMMLSPEEMLEEFEERGVEPSYDLNGRIALVFAISQTVSFLSLDAMLWTHRGGKANFQRFFPVHGRCAVVPWLVTAALGVILILTMSLSQVRDLSRLSVFGCLLVFGQVVLRTVGMKYFPVSAEAMERALHNDYASIHEKRRWPNVTEPGNPVT